MWTYYRLTPPRQRRNELARHEGSKAPRQNNNRTQPPTPLSPTAARELGDRRRCRCRRHTSATTFLSLLPLQHRPRAAVTGGGGAVPGQRRGPQNGATTTSSSSSSSSCTGGTAVFLPVVVAPHGILVARDAVPAVAREDPAPADVVDVVVSVVAVTADDDDDGGGCSRPRVLAGFHGRRARTPLAHTAAAVHSPRPRSTRRRRRCCRRRRHRRHAPTSAPPRQRRSRDRLPQGPRTRTPRRSWSESRSLPPPLLLLLPRLLLCRHATPRHARRGCPTHHWLADAHERAPIATMSSGRSSPRLVRRVTRDVPAAHTRIVQRPNRGDTASLSRANMELDPCRIVADSAAGRRARAQRRGGRARGREKERERDSARARAYRNTAFGAAPSRLSQACQRDTAPLDNSGCSRFAPDAASGRRARSAPRATRPRGDLDIKIIPFHSLNWN